MIKWTNDVSASSYLISSHSRAPISKGLVLESLNRKVLPNKKWNESGFRPLLCTYRLNWAMRTSWGWWDDWDDTVLQTQDSKFEPWRSEAEHATSRSRRLPTILTFTRGWGRNNFVSFKPPRPGTEPRTLAWKAAVLTTTLGPPPCCLITPIQAYLTENLICTQSYILYSYHTSWVTHASLFPQVGLLHVGILHVGLLHVGRHYHWRWDNIGPTYLHMSYSKPDTLLLALGQHWPNIYLYLSNQEP